MEKRLRACGVNIIPRNRGYFSDSESYSPPAVNNRPQLPTSPPSSVRNAKNPIALRYWNQCMDKTAMRESNELQHKKESSFISISDGENRKLDEKQRTTAAVMQAKVPDITKRVRSESVPRTFRTFKVTATVSPSPALVQKVNKPAAEVVKVFSTTGTGFIKEEVNDALATVDKSKKEDDKRTFHSVNFNTKSPIPFYSYLSEASTQNQCKCSHENNTPQNIEALVHKLSPAKKTQLGQTMFNQLPDNVVEGLIAQKLSTMSRRQLDSVFSRLQEEIVNNVVPNLFPRTSDDVKLSLILDCLPKLSVQKILKDLNDSEKEMRKESLRKMTQSLMSHKGK